jgi:GDPmannose 4,6-dehydratase
LEWQKYIELDPRYLRPTEVDYLLGDPSKSKKLLNWQPRTAFRDLVIMMVDHDLVLAQGEAAMHQAGFGASSRGNASQRLNG